MQLTSIKTVAFLGDSITEGCGASTPANGFVGVIDRKWSDVRVLNYGIGGTRIARSEYPGAKPKYDQCFLDRVDGIDPDAEVIAVFGGTNDFGHGNGKLGTPEDGPESEFTFYGALRSLCLRLIRRFPKARIVFLTPLHRRSEGATTNEIGLPCHPLCDYVKAIKEVCAEYSLPVLDLFATAGIQPMIPEQREAFCPDGLHPNDAGAARLADRVIAFLETL